MYWTHGCHILQPSVRVILKIAPNKGSSKTSRPQCKGVCGQLGIHNWEVYTYIDSEGKVNFCYTVHIYLKHKAIIKSHLNLKGAI